MRSTDSDRPVLMFKSSASASTSAPPVGTSYTKVWGAAAEFERLMLGQRTREGLAAARHRGVRLGRPPKLKEGELARASMLLRNPGTTIASVAKQFGVAPWSLTRSMRRLTAVEAHQANRPLSDES